MAKLIGTAGHVDHGKTTLIQALTGIDADRLPEEKRRGMTIDIGFAFVDLPNIGRVSIVDVPGHEKFITNMLVGALGIDVALLCISADESVMPQTREHLQILELLPVDKLIVALTRADLADAETREFATAEVEELIAGSRFKVAPIVGVSAHTGEGLDALKAELTTALSGDAPPPSGPWYLPVDRAFAVKGHGCVVTGTLAQGKVSVGDRAFLEPGHVEVRVRALHSHGEALEAGDKGRRTAVNLTGVKLEDVRRGQAVGAPGALFETQILDARVRWVGERKHGLRVRVSIGAEEAIGKIFLSDVEPEVAQLRLETPVACALNQPLIIRRYSPPDLIAGGRVIVPLAQARKKAEAVTLVEEGGGDEDAILQVTADKPNGVTTEEICRVLGKTPQALGDTFEALSKSGQVRGFAGLWIAADAFTTGVDRFREALVKLHEQFPTSALLPREKVTAEAGLKWSGKPLDRIMAAMAAEGLLRVEGTAVRDPQFSIKLTPRQREFLDRVKFELEKAGISTPNLGDLARAVGAPSQAVEEILRLGTEASEVIRIGDGVYYTAKQLESLKTQISDMAKGKPFAASDVRDAFNTSRKYVIPLLEYFDSIRFTLRVGDNRMVRDQQG
jgi:selenocysteine-specific elongation factor